MRQVQLVVQPDDGTAPTLNAIRHARKTIDLTVFRFDRADVANALEAAVARGVRVRALIAMTNGGGVRQLRRLEWRLLESGANVARSNDDFARYHAKIMIVDDRALHINGFNFTAADLASRSFGVITTNPHVLQQATTLFEADFAHRTYSGTDGLVVSPENARARLETFIQGARRELLIYDAKLGDPRVLRLLAERVRAGVTIRIIGRIGKHAGRNGTGAPRLHDSGAVYHPRHRREAGRTVTINGADALRPQVTRPRHRQAFQGEHAGDACYIAGMRVAELGHRRMHLRAIVRDGSAAFVGSQSLRAAELDKRREVGLFIHEPDVVRQIRDTFERDWPSINGDGVTSVEHLDMLP